MRISVVSAFLGLLAMAAVAQPAFAYDRDHDHDGWRGRHEWHRGYAWAAPRPRYYAPAYYYPAYYYQPYYYRPYYPAPVYPAPAYGAVTFRFF